MGAGSPGVLVNRAYIQACGKFSRKEDRVLEARA